MARFNFKTGLLIGAVLCAALIASCLKSEDPEPASPPNELTSRYCNDPNAINYNWGFPGIADSTLCIYPVDHFLGQWTLTDSVFHADSSFNYAATQTLTFTATEDTLRSHLKVSGLCDNGNMLLATADKYGRAVIDSMNYQTPGQFFCSQADTVTGSFQFWFSGKDTMDVRLNIIGAEAGYHKGVAIRN